LNSRNKELPKKERKAKIRKEVNEKLLYEFKDIMLDKAEKALNIKV
jgi:hypothetical protein